MMLESLQPALGLTFRDLAYLGALVVSIALSYGRLRSDVRHLDDVKADRREVELLGAEIRQRLADILTSLARLEQAMRHSPGSLPEAPTGEGPISVP